MNSARIVLPGSAGLVGQNLVAQLKRQGYSNLVVFDKHRSNLEILRKMRPDVVAEYADPADRGDREKHLVGAEFAMMPQAQIGGNDFTQFQRNNTDSIGLVAHDKFEVIDWPGLFGVTPTPFTKAIDDTYNDPACSQIALDF